MGEMDSRARQGVTICRVLTQKEAEVLPILEQRAQTNCEGDCKDGIKRITGKYDSPRNLLIPRQSTQTSMNGLDKHCGPAKSNCSSDIPDAAPTWPNNIHVEPNFSEGVTDQDILQVETFYKSHKTEICVCRCLANLYFGDKNSSVGRGDTWQFHQTGIPVLLLDSGEHHRQRKLSIIVSEKGTGFSLWRESIDHLSKYTAPSSHFHIMNLSTDHTKQAGLSFDEPEAAAEFYSFILALADDPNDDLFKLSKKKKKKKKEKKPKYKAPKKTDISQPCCFVHVTKLERPEFPPPPSRLGDLSSMLGANMILQRSTSSDLSDDSTSQSAASEQL